MRRAAGAWPDALLPGMTRGAAKPERNVAQSRLFDVPRTRGLSPAGRPPSSIRIARIADWRPLVHLAGDPDPARVPLGATAPRPDHGTA